MFRACSILYVHLWVRHNVQVILIIINVFSEIISCCSEQKIAQDRALGAATFHWFESRIDITYSSFHCPAIQKGMHNPYGNV